MAINVSIVIPTYNQNLSYLSEAIDSALNQTYPREKYEILVVDDESTRLPPDPIIPKYEKQNVKFIKKAHGRTAHTLNVGIKRMQGRYFKWVSSDDALTENCLEVLMNKANENTIVYGDWIKIDQNSRQLDVQHEPAFKNQSEMKRCLWRNFFGNGGAALIPRSAFNKVGLFDQSLPYIEDYDWWLRAAFLHNYKFVHVDEVVAKYRVHQGQISTQLNKRDRERLITRWLIKKRIYEALDDASKADALPKPSTKLFFQQLLVSDAAMLYGKVAGINPLTGRARTPPGIQKRIRRLVRL
jgi:glycosyltransferase involved in cell wall biosynthesis